MIEFKNVSVSFEDKKIISGFSLKVSNGDKIVITGKSGLGKSTIIKLILGLILPDSGQILFNGKVLDKHHIWDLRKSAAYVNQNSDIGEGNVLKQFKRYLDFKANRNLSMDGIKKFLMDFSLPADILNKNIEELSGGERQRIAIIIALLLNRKIFLLDEITASLDVDLKNSVADYFLNNRLWTIIAISHDEAWQNNPNVKLIEPEWSDGR